MFGEIMWILAVTCSAFFAGVTAILSKCGIKNVKSGLATAVRTTIVLVFAWLIVFVTGEYKSIVNVSGKSWIFLVLSGLATGASWLCYMKALRLGEVSKVAAVDKSSVIFSVLLAIIIFPEERNVLWLKIICLLFIGAGTFLMTDVKIEKRKTKLYWLILAQLSAVFAAAASLLAKVGIESVDSNLAMAIRTLVVFFAAWCIVFLKKEHVEVKNIQKKDFIFLILSGIATGASWLCFYYAIKNGQVSVVVPIDKMSILITVLFSLVVFKEKLSAKSWFGLSLITVGTLLMAIFA